MGGKAAVDASGASKQSNTKPSQRDTPSVEGAAAIAQRRPAFSVCEDHEIPSNTRKITDPHTWWTAFTSERLVVGVARNALSVKVGKHCSGRFELRWRKCRVRQRASSAFSIILTFVLCILFNMLHAVHTTGSVVRRSAAIAVAHAHGPSCAFSCLLQAENQ